MGFKRKEKKKKCLQRLQLPFGNEALSRVALFRWFTEFHKCPNSLLVAEHAGRISLAVVPENVSTIRKMLINALCK